jgi:hypothetical protein
MEDAEELLFYAAKVMKITWPQPLLKEGTKRWNPLDNDADCFIMAYTLGLIIEPMGFETLASLRYSLVQRAAYLGRHM